MKKSTIAEVTVNYSHKPQSKTKINSPSAAYKALLNNWNDKILYQESFYLLLMNRANKPLGFQMISSGGTSGTIVDVKMILQSCILTNSHGVIMAHNHPSGNLKPSRQDIQLTNKVKDALKLMDIGLTDHLIISPDGFYSFSEEGLMGG